MSNLADLASTLNAFCKGRWSPEEEVLDKLSSAWFMAVEGLGWSDMTIFAVGSYIIHQTLFVAFSTFFCLAHYYNWLPQYRIQKGAGKFNVGLFKACLYDVTKRLLVTELPTLFVLYFAFHHFGTRVRAPLPPLRIILRDWLLAFLWTDTTFYWSHRLFHHRLLYKWIHKKHHEFKTPMAINTEYAHPLEHLVGNVLTTVGGPLLLGSHVLVFWAYFVFRLIETFDAHSGYSISPFSRIPFLTGADMHDFHHSHNVGCYGTYTAFWDWVTGTDRAYKAYVQSQQKREGQKQKQQGRQAGRGADSLQNGAEKP